MTDRERLLTDHLWGAKAEIENRAGDLERQALSLREKARELSILLDPPIKTNSI